jgi:broad specificity phosphatase PhoE
MVTVWFIRHGESESNAGLPTSDPASVPLTVAGHRQAKRVCQAFAKAPSLFVTSPYLRTKQTAQPSLARFTGVPHAEWPVHEFTYLAPAQCRNTTFQERAPMKRAYWERCDPRYVDGDGAESFAQLMRRIRQMHVDLQQSGADFIAVFTHGLFLRAALWAWLTGSFESEPEQMGRFRSFASGFDIPNAALLEAQFCDGRVRFGGLQTDHLDTRRESI